MPGDRIGALLEIVTRRGIAGAPMNKMNLWKAFWSTTGWVDVARTKVLGKVQRFLDWQIREVLRSEGNDLPLSNESREFVSAGLVQLAQLDSSHLSTDIRREILHRRIGKKIGKGRIGVFAMFNGFEGNRWWILHVAVEMGVSIRNVSGLILPDLLPVRKIIRVLCWRMVLCAVQLNIVLGRRGALLERFLVVGSLVLIFLPRLLSRLVNRPVSNWSFDQSWSHFES